jgi:hypothetical protein
MPSRDEEGLAAAAGRALTLPAADREALIDQATATAAEHDLPPERNAFLSVLKRVDELL